MNELYSLSSASPILRPTNSAEDLREEQLIDSLLAAAIGREPLAEDFGRVELSYSLMNPKLRFISVDGKCLGALVYEQEMLVGDNKIEKKEIIRFDPDIKR